MMMDFDILCAGRGTINPVWSVKKTAVDEGNNYSEISTALRETAPSLGAPLNEQLMTLVDSL